MPFWILHRVPMMMMLMIYKETYMLQYMKLRCQSVPPDTFFFGFIYPTLTLGSLLLLHHAIPQI